MPQTTQTTQSRTPCRPSRLSYHADGSQLHEHLEQGFHRADHRRVARAVLRLDAGPEDPQVLADQRQRSTRLRLAELPKEIENLKYGDGRRGRLVAGAADRTVQGTDRPRPRLVQRHAPAGESPDRRGPRRRREAGAPRHRRQDGPLRLRGHGSQGRRTVPRRVQSKGGRREDNAGGLGTEHDHDPRGTQTPSREQRPLDAPRVDDQRYATRSSPG